MGFDPQFIAEVKRRTRLSAVIGRDVKLKAAGHEMLGLCPAHNDSHASLAVIDRDGFFYCHPCGYSGDAIAWLTSRHGFTFVEAVEELAIQAGLSADRAGRKPLRAAPVVQRSKEEADRDEAEAIRKCIRIWRAPECGQIAGTLGETYLNARGLFAALMPGGAWPMTLRFHPSLAHPHQPGRYPAIVVPSQDGDGRLVGIHRTYLAKDGTRKAGLKDANGYPADKCMKGRAWGCAVRLGPAGAAMDLGEGLENTLTAMQASGRSAWATLSLGNFGAVMLPPVCRRVTFWTDSDESDRPAARRQIEAAAERQAVEFGRQVSLQPAPEGQDWNGFHLDRMRAADRRGTAHMGEAA